MTDARKAKIDGIAVPDQEIALGDETGTLAVVGWGSTYGPIRQAAAPSLPATRSATSTFATSGRCRAIWASCCPVSTRCWCRK